MTSQPIASYILRFLKGSFSERAQNSPYADIDFMHVLLDAVEHVDFTNNTCIRVGGPTGETVFNQLRESDFDQIKEAFYSVLDRILPSIKQVLRNRQVALAFDVTDEPFYGKVAGLWISPQQPVRGATGCFKYLTVSAVDQQNKLILGSLPVRIGADHVSLVMKLLQHARRYITPEVCLFDRGFDDHRLIDALQQAGVRYQILWCKHKWTKAEFKNMKNGSKKEVTRTVKYNHNKSYHKIKVRFVLIKKYIRYQGGKAFNWVFATNTRRKWQHQYVDKYKKRWGIETAFRVLDNIQIKTTTKNPIIRYFINLFCCLVYNLWKYARVLGCKVTLKNFVVQTVTVIKTAHRMHHIPDG